MGLGDILDTVFRLYRQNFVTFVGVVALLQVPVMVLQMLLTLALGRGVATDLLSLTEGLPRFDPGSDSFSEFPIGSLVAFFGISLFLALIQVIVVQQLINGALANAVAKSYLNQPVSILGAYNLGARHILSLIVAGLLLGLIGTLLFVIPLGLFFVLILLFAPAQGQGGGTIVLLIMFAMLAFVGLVVLTAVMALSFLFVTQSIVLEDCNPIEALVRSWRLVWGAFWRVLGTALVLYLMVSILQGIPAASLGGLIGFVFDDPINDFAMRQTFTTLVSYGAQIVFLPLQLTAYTLLYYDVRIRREGYDLQLQAEALKEEGWGMQ